MLFTIGIILFVFRLLGFTVFRITKGLIHIVLVVALVMILISVIGGR
ncbi:MAG: lmo0937 family membrane protein [candidate division SR1 bacterium]|nr:lmo0937 family membrane protein [candidate division SR1 bacterium]